jgi:hypothetical protein
MAETQKFSTGAKSEVWIEDSPGAGTYTKLHHVKRFGHPTTEREKLEGTHLESDAKEYVAGDAEPQEFDIVVNYRPGSDTDLRLEELAGEEDDVSIILIRAVRGVLTRQYTFNAQVLSYAPDEAERGSVTEAIAKVQASGAITSAAYTTVKGEAVVTLQDGRTLTLAIDWNALIEGEEALPGESMMDVIASMGPKPGQDEASMPRPRLKVMRALLYAATRKHHGELTVADAGNLLGEGEEVAIALLSALGNAFDDGKAATADDGDEGPPAKK